MAVEAHMLASQSHHLQANIVVVLLDVYSYLDNVKYPMSQVRQRMYYYKFIVIAALESIGVPAAKVTFVEESSYQFSREWIMDQWRICTLVPQQAVKDAWDRSYNPDMLSPMFCPVIQTLAEEHLDVDFQFGGADQRGIFAFAERFLPQLGYRERGHLMNPMIPNLHGSKMSSSHPPKTKIMFLDDVEAVKSKVIEAPWHGLDTVKNGVLSLLKNVLIPIAQLQLEQQDALGTTEINGAGYTNGETPMGTSAAKGAVFTVEVDGKCRNFSSYSDVEQSLADGSIQPDAIKAAVAKGIDDLLDHVRKMYKNHPEWQAVDKLAYPETA
ncbi:hypothetical protein OEA41_008592 [Lepraria neglecta]|uniref:tyrosine--tRNA ligase n=1 Tax=Lepraria neglecta TaxID=209136 RepID=A0AAE0DH27_9LECA|nr:hypothetical protein OEA41_008592 [Lepraria neglecta]